MKQPRPDDAGAPLPESLAAYVDGELDAAARQEMEAWLACHPQAAADIEAQRRLAALWQAAGQPEPAAAEWDAVLARIDSALPVHRPARPRWRRPVRRITLAVGGLAAALLLVLIFPRPPAPQDDASPEAEPFAVVSPDDVEIVRVHAADRMSLVVGTPPLEEGEVAWVLPGDVKVEKIVPDTDGMVPLVALNDGPIAAMIMAPLDPVAKPAP